jgi:hypothetical protein
MEFGLDTDGEFGKDGAGPLFDSSPSSFRIDFHMGSPHQVTNNTYADQYPNS